MKAPWKYLFPADIREPESTGGSEARIQAERELAKTVAQTPYYAGLGNDLREERTKNQIAERIRAGMLRGHQA